MDITAPPIAPKVLYTIGDFDITITMFSSWLVTVAVILFAVIVRVFFVPRWNRDVKHTSGFRMVMEYLVGMFDSSAKDMTGKYARGVGAIYFGCSAYIMFGILIELFGLRSPLSDLNCNIVLGLITFFTIMILGFVRHRARRLMHYAPIIPLVTDCVVPFSMALRLFGSVYSGFLIMDIVYQTALANVLPVVLEPIFTLFHAIMQSYIFMFLSMNFINEAIE